MISKEMFLSTIEFIKDLENKQDRFILVLEDLSPQTYCDCFLYSNVIDKLINILEDALEDNEGLIEYYLYDFQSLPEEVKAKQLQETPEIATPETVYDYLVSHILN